MATISPVSVAPLHTQLPSQCQVLSAWWNGLCCHGRHPTHLSSVLLQGSLWSPYRPPTHPLPHRWWSFRKEKSNIHKTKHWHGMVEIISCLCQNHSSPSTLGPWFSAGYTTILSKRPHFQSILWLLVPKFWSMWITGSELEDFQAVSVKGQGGVPFSLLSAVWNRDMRTRAHSGSHLGP